MSVELLEDGFPHGTIHGHEQGCRGRICPGREAYGWSCAEAMVRFRGDWGFRKRVMAGLGPAEIAAVEAQEAVEAREVERAARRAERAAQRRLVAVPRGSRVDVRGRVRKTERTARSFTEDELARIGELNAAGWTDARIGRELGHATSSVRDRRVALGLPRVRQYAHTPIIHGKYSGYLRGCRDECCVSVARAWWRERDEKARAKRRQARMQEKAS